MRSATSKNGVTQAAPEETTLLRRLGRRAWRATLRASRYSVLALIIGVLAFLLLDKLFPLPIENFKKQGSALITDRHGTPLRAFADENGVWRYPIKLKNVSPGYVKALLAYEDRWYYQHHGVNPLALMRAGWQSVRHGRFVSGGSTLTMQVARLMDPHDKTIAGKLKQMFRALQLERHYSKEQILTFYINHAPFGGTIEGVEAASRAYLGKSAKELSDAEAAMLAVLPQSPTRLRPDMYPQRTQQARDKVIRRMVKFGLWSPERARMARMEKVKKRAFKQPMIAPLFARRLKDRALKKGLLRTTLDANIQLGLERRLRDYLAQLPEKTSIAILVVDNNTMAVRAYLGSASFLNEDRFGHVDMVTSLRSPGSTLKPFLYGLALEDGLIHSESLLSDAPISYGEYRPGNFHGNFHGPISASDALRLSLNIPAVQLMYHYTPEKFVSRVENGGLKLVIPQNAKPNLSVILGGAGTSLESLVTGYTAFGRDGLAGKLRFTLKDKPDEYRMLSSGAAWIVRDILENHDRPGIPSRFLNWSHARKVAWKTGTSFGYRDAWSIGVTYQYTIGVWVGRPDGTPMPGHYGAITAAPILFDVVDSLPTRNINLAPPDRPKSVVKQKICWPLGIRYDAKESSLCHVKKEAWTINAVAPPTLPDAHKHAWNNRRVKYWVSDKTKKLVDMDCNVKNKSLRILARWPQAIEPWLAAEYRARSALPLPDPRCTHIPDQSIRTVKILGMMPQTVIRQPGPNAPAPKVELGAMGGSGKLFWLVNGKLIRKTAVNEPFNYEFKTPGYYQVTVTDLKGQHDSVEIKVIN